MGGTHALTDHQIGMNLLRPARQLGVGDIRIKILGPDDDFEIRPKIVFQDGRDTAVTASAHSMDIEYDVSSGLRHGVRGS